MSQDLLVGRYGLLNVPKSKRDLRSSYVDQKYEWTRTEFDGICDEEQCLLAGCNGLLSLRKPERHVRPSHYAAKHEHAADMKEWVGTDLDSICVEELLEELATLPKEDPPMLPRPRHRTQIAWKCPHIKQSRLSSKNGVVIVQGPEQFFGRETTLADLHMNDSSKPRPSLLLLPPELRLQIYRHLLVQRDPISYPIRPSADGLRIVTDSYGYAEPELHPKILATCRFINREGTPILYGENEFEREFTWAPRCRRSDRPRPLWGSYPLDSQKIQPISPISLPVLSFGLRLTYQYGKWLSSHGELKVFQDFPSLQELRLHIDTCCSSAPMDLMDLWRNAMRSASRKKPKLKRLSCSMRIFLPLDLHEPLDFRAHKIRKRSLEE